MSDINDNQAEQENEQDEVDNSTEQASTNNTTKDYREQKQQALDNLPEIESESLRPAIPTPATLPEINNPIDPDTTLDITKNYSGHINNASGILDDKNIGNTAKFAIKNLTTVIDVAESIQDVLTGLEAGVAPEIVLRELAQFGVDVTMGAVVGAGAIYLANLIAGNTLPGRVLKVAGVVVGTMAAGELTASLNNEFNPDRLGNLVYIEKEVDGEVVGAWHKIRVNPDEQFLDDPNSITVELTDQGLIDQLNDRRDYLSLVQKVNIDENGNASLIYKGGQVMTINGDGSTSFFDPKTGSAIRVDSGTTYVYVRKDGDVLEVPLNRDDNTLDMTRAAEVNESILLNEPNAEELSDYKIVCRQAGVFREAHWPKIDEQVKTEKLLKGARAEALVLRALGRDDKVNMVVDSKLSKFSDDDFIMKNTYEDGSMELTVYIDHKAASRTIRTKEGEQIHQRKGKDDKYETISRKMMIKEAKVYDRPVEHSSCKLALDESESKEADEMGLEF